MSSHKWFGELPVQLLEQLQAENHILKTENSTLKTENSALKTENVALKEEINALKFKLKAPVVHLCVPNGWLFVVTIFLSFHCFIHFAFYQFTCVILCLEHNRQWSSSKSTNAYAFGNLHYSEQGPACEQVWRPRPPIAWGKTACERWRCNRYNCSDRSTEKTSRRISVRICVSPLHVNLCVHGCICIQIPSV